MPRRLRYTGRFPPRKLWDRFSIAALARWRAEVLKDLVAEVQALIPRTLMERH